MPGGRLTYADRRRIAAGLAGGLGYAEIARRLERPTSTVSREVTRNGGHDGYQADQAHQAAGRRAARRKPAAHHALPAGHGPDRAVAHAFEERFTAMMVQTGLPQMMARVLVSLFVSDAGSLSAAELVQRLHVSPASVSKAVAYLERVGMVSRERDPRNRRERYSLGEDVWHRTWARSIEFCVMWAQAAGDGAEVLGPDTPAGARLDEMRQFFSLVAHDTAQVSEHWRQFLAARRQPVADA